MDAERVRLRPITAEDLPFLARVYASTRTEELARTGWPEAIIDAFLLQQFQAQHTHYQTYYSDARYDVVQLDGVDVGRLYTSRGATEIRIVDIALLPEARGSGLGTYLLRQVLDAADAAGLAVAIHVERENPALRLYERLGFRLAEDKGVYLFLVRPAGGAAG